MSAPLTDADAASETPPAGSVPLNKIEHEIYARERVYGMPITHAAQRAGLGKRSGAGSKIETLPEVQERMAWLRRDEDAIIREKRRRIEEELNAVVVFDVTDYAEIDDGSGELKSIDWRKVRNSGLSRVVSEFAFDPKTGQLTKFKRDDRLNAIAQLRDMHGFKAPQKIAPTSPDGAAPYDPLTVSDEDRFKALQAFLNKIKLKSEA